VVEAGSEVDVYRVGVLSVAIAVLVAACSSASGIVEPLDPSHSTTRSTEAVAAPTSTSIPDAPHPAQIEAPELVGEWVLLTAVFDDVLFERSDDWRPDLIIGELWGGNDGCNGFGFQMFNGQFGMWVSEIGCGDLQQLTGLLSGRIRDATSAELRVDVSLSTGPE